MFRGRIPCHCWVWWRFPAEAAAFCLLPLSELLSWALDFSWLCWELSCWHCPRSLPLPLLLSCSLSLSRVFRSLAPLALPFWIPAPVYDSIYVDVSRKMMDFVWIYMHLCTVWMCVYVGAWRVRPKERARWKEMTLAACASHPCPQSQLHPMHSFIGQTGQKKAVDGGISHAQRKPLFLSCPLNADTCIKAQNTHTNTCQIWDSPSGITPMTHTQEKAFPKVQSVFIEKKVRWDAGLRFIAQSSVGLVKFRPLAQPNVMHEGGGIRWRATPQTVLWSGVKVCYCDNMKGQWVQTLASKTQDSPRLPLHWPGYRNHPWTHIAPISWENQQSEIRPPKEI